MEFNACMKHKLVRKSVREFAEAELGPIAHEIDRQARFPLEVIEKMRPLNFFGLQAPKRYGGAELDAVVDGYVEESSTLELQEWMNRPWPGRYVDNVARLTSALQ